MRSLAVIAVLLFTFTACSEASDVTPLPEAHLSCTADTDCVVVQTKGCSCLCKSENYSAVNKNHAEQHKAADTCTEAELRTCATNGMCGQPAARCVESRCVK